MTRGAALAFLFFFVVVVFGFVRTEQIASRQRHVVAANRVAISTQLHALSEVCRSEHVLQALVEARVEVDQFNLDHKLVPPASVRIVERTVRTFHNYLTVLGGGAACGEILNP